jgi:hypothetical protein
MARHARRLPARGHLDEALRLDPESAMVNEAARLLAAEEEAAENA